MTNKTARSVLAANTFDNYDGLRQTMRYVEGTIIGGVLLNSSDFGSLAEVIQPQDFFWLYNAEIWASMLRLYDGDRAIDIHTVAHHMSQSKSADFDMPMDEHAKRIAEYMGYNKKAYNLVDHAHILREYAARQRLRMAGDAIKALADNRSVVFESLSNQANEILSTATARNDIKQSDAYSIAESMLDMAIIAFENGGFDRSIKTGFENFDDAYGGGFLPNTVNVLVGGEGQGKTTWGLSVIYNLMTKDPDKSAVIFSLEMTREEIMAKLVTMLTSIPMNIIINGKFNKEQYSQFVKALGVISQWNLHIVDDLFDLTPSMMKRRIKHIGHHHTIDFVLLDGLWLMQADDPKIKEAHNIVRANMPPLTEMAREFKIPILAIHQFLANIMNERDQKPRMEHLNVGVRQTAHTIYAMHRPPANPQKPPVTKVYELKHRFNPSREMRKDGQDFTFLNRQQRFVEATNGN